MEESKWKGAFAGVIQGEEEQVVRVNQGLVSRTVLLFSLRLVT